MGRHVEKKRKKGKDEGRFLIRNRRGKKRMGSFWEKLKEKGPITVILYAAKVCHKHESKQRFFSIHKKAGGVYHKPALQDVKRNPPGRMKKISCRNVDLDKEMEAAEMAALWKIHTVFILI